MTRNLFFTILCLFILSSCDPFNTNIGSDVSYYQAQNIIEAKDSDSLKIMTWNVKFGGGRIDFFFDCHGQRVIMTSKEVESNMKNICEVIKDENPDIIFLQEVDIHSKRSADIDQVKYIIDNTQLNYAVYASQWRSSFIPKKGIGNIDSGNAILSKRKLKNAKRTPLPLIAEQNPIVRYFYLRRNILEAQQDSLTLITTHLSAYAQDDTKKRQVLILKQYLDSINNSSQTFIIGADLNCLPPHTLQTNNFEDNACTGGEYDANNYNEETKWLLPFYQDYASAVILSDYKMNNNPFFTHTTDKKGVWNRKLDYLFSNSSWVSKYSKTLQIHRQESDHSAITSTIILN